MSLSLDTIKALLDEFPNEPSRGIARIAYGRNSGLWPNLEACRAAVLYLRGNRGDVHRKNAADKSHFRPNGQSGLGYFQAGEPRVFGEPWAPVVINGPLRGLILTDIHVPYHDKSALDTVWAFAKKLNPDLILLGGDAADCHLLSKWIKDPRDRDFPTEVLIMRDFLKRLRHDFKKARIVYKLGNHEERWINFMRLKAKELIGLAEFEFKAVYECAKHGIEVVDDKRPVRLGDLNFIHGHEYRFAISNPVNPARGLFLRAKAYAMCGHFHQPSHHSENTVEESAIATWSTGCLCDLHPEYAPLNNWQHGFAFVEVAKDGKFQVQNKVIKAGKIY